MKPTLVSAELKPKVKRWIPPALLELYYRAARNNGSKNAQFTLPVKTLSELFPSTELSSVTFPVAQIQNWHEWTLPPLEKLALAGIGKACAPRRIFEIGTYTGASTLIMALNTPANTEIFTLDIEPTAVKTHKHGLGVGGFPLFTPGSAFRGTESSRKIHQIFGDSQVFDFTPFRGSIDMVFLDADHTYEFVKKDTEIAFSLLSQGGIIVWDDYRWTAQHPECAGVTRCVNEFSRSHQCYNIAGTRLAIYLSSFR